MIVLRRAGALAVTGALLLSTAACTAEGRIGEDGIDAEIEGEGGEGGGEGDG